MEGSVLCELRSQEGPPDGLEDATEWEQATVDFLSVSLSLLCPHITPNTGL
jgi:hypothetical protein